MYAILWGIPASIIVTSFLYGISALYSIAKDLKKSVWIKVNINDDNDGLLPKIAILVPLYKENRHSIAETFRSIAEQIYPADRLAVYVILENGDEETKNYVKECIGMLSNANLRVHIHINSGKRSSKANAMNGVVREVVKEYEAVMILDAGDRIPDRYYIRKCAELIKRGYNVIGTKVYRVGEGVVARLSYIDTVLWYNVGLPGIHSLTKVPFLSGEGMVVTTRFLKQIEKFPEVLAEDTYLAMLVFIRKEKTALVDSVVFEGAPATLGSLFKQRLRWYRGILECLKDFLLKYRGSVSRLEALRVCIAYVRVVVLIAPFISVAIVLMSLFVPIPFYVLIIAQVELVSLAISPIFIYHVGGVRDSALFLAPINWILQGFIAFVALLPMRIPWFRTSSRSEAVVKTLSTT